MNDKSMPNNKNSDIKKIKSKISIFIKKHIYLFSIIITLLIILFCYVLAYLLSLPANKSFATLSIIQEYGVNDWLSFWLSLISIGLSILLNIVVIDLTRKYYQKDENKRQRALRNQWANSLDFNKIKITVLPYTSLFDKMLFFDLKNIKKYNNIVKLTFCSDCVLPPNIKLEINSISIKTIRFVAEYIDADNQTVDKNDKYGNMWVSSTMNNFKFLEYDVTQNTTFSLSQCPKKQSCAIYRTFLENGRLSVDIYFLIYEIDKDNPSALLKTLNDLVLVGKTQRHISQAKIELFGALLENDDLESSTSNISNSKSNKNETFKLVSYLEVVSPTMEKDRYPAELKIFRNFFYNDA